MLLSLVSLVGVLCAVSMSVHAYQAWSDRELTVEGSSFSQPENVEGRASRTERSGFETHGALHLVMQEILATAGPVDDVSIRSSWLVPSESALHSIEFVYVGAFSDLMLTLGPLLTRYSSLSAESISVQRNTPHASEVEARIRLTLLTSA